jgi:hypothetical protein
LRFLNEFAERQTLLAAGNGRGEEYEKKIRVSTDVIFSVG